MPIMYTLRKKPKRIHYYQESGTLQLNDVINGRIFRELEAMRSCHEGEDRDDERLEAATYGGVRENATTH